MSDMQSKTTVCREQWVDVCRGLGIILVLLGHSDPPFKWLIYGFHMPLFFMLSGYLFRSGQDMGSYLRKLFRRYIIPYFAMCFINLVLQCIRVCLGDTLTWDLLKHYLVDIIYSGEWLPNCLPLWFLPAIFITMVLMNFVHQIRQTKVRFIVVLICLLLAVLMAQSGYSYFPWSINKAFTGLFFAEAGFCLKQYDVIGKIRKTRFYVSTLMLVALLVTGVFIVRVNNRILGGIVTINDVKPSNVLLTVSGASLLAAFFIMAIALLSDIIPDKLLVLPQSLGKHTMIYFGFDFCACSLAEDIIRNIGNLQPNWFGMFLMKFAILIPVSLLWYKAVKPAVKNRRSAE